MIAWASQAQASHAQTTGTSNTARTLCFSDVITITLTFGRTADCPCSLEAFCNDHSQYLCVRSSQSAGTELPVASGHALMLSCPPLSHIENTPSEPYPHQAPPIPTPSLSNLLHAAMQLPMNGDGEITPVMALKLIQDDMRYPTMRFKDLLGVQEELKAKTRCYGYVHAISCRFVEMLTCSQIRCCC